MTMLVSLGLCQLVIYLPNVLQSSSSDTLMEQVKRFLGKGSVSEILRIYVHF